MEEERNARGAENALSPKDASLAPGKRAIGIGELLRASGPRRPGVAADRFEAGGELGGEAVLLESEPEEGEGMAFSDWGADDEAELDAGAIDWDDGSFSEIKAPRRHAKIAAKAARPKRARTKAAARLLEKGEKAPPPFGEPASFLLTPRAPPSGESAPIERRKDPLSIAQRSALMAKVKSAKTKPEIALRDALRHAGLIGYRLAPKTLPGKPDFAFGRARVAVFVDGCFWHGCSACYRQPEGNKEYWAEKKLRNMSRDVRVNEELESIGWMPVRFWEHELRGEGARDAAERVQLLVGQRLAQGLGKTRGRGQ